MRIILFTGKGGVGKTTIAAATAIRLADRGVKTLLLSTDAAHSLADALNCPLGGEPVEVHPSLWAVQIDTQRRFEVAWRELQRYLIDILARGGVDAIAVSVRSMSSLDHRASRSARCLMYRPRPIAGARPRCRASAPGPCRPAQLHKG